RLILVAMAVGPGAWALLQWLRRGRGVQLDSDCLLIQHSITGRARRIPLAAVRSFTTTSGDRLLLLYRPPDKAPAANTTSDGPLALTNIRPESHQSRPRYKLAVTPALNQPREVVEALAGLVQPVAPGDIQLLSDDLLAWARRRRVRNFILVVL